MVNKKQITKVKSTTKKTKKSEPKNKVLAVAKSLPSKNKYDTEAFTFDTPLELVQQALDRMEEQDADPMAEPFTKDELYWFGWWTLNMPEVKRRGLTVVPLCAKERAVLKLYEKPKRRTKK